MCPVNSIYKVGVLTIQQQWHDGKRNKRKTTKICIGFKKKSKIKKGRNAYVCMYVCMCVYVVGILYFKVYFRLNTTMYLGKNIVVCKKKILKV